MIQSIAANGPAAGKLQAGDVLLRAWDANGTWDGYEQLRNGLWAQGKLGTEVTLTFLRNEETVEATLVRGRVEGFDYIMAEVWDNWQHFLSAVRLPDQRASERAGVSVEFIKRKVTNENMIYGTWNEIKIVLT